MSGTWTGPMWKPSPAERRLGKHARRLKLENDEEKEKRKVRRREGHKCRFPLCGCRVLRLRLEVSHQYHKGAGGNPAGDRSSARDMVLLCVQRHQDGTISRHKGTMRARYLTRQGYDGPVAWDVDVAALSARGGRPRWRELARESAPGVLEPLLDWQREALEQLADMAL